MNENKNNIKAMAVHGVAWTMVEKYSGQIVQFIIQIILARLLTPSEYGLIGVLAIFMAISTVFIDGGFSAALIQCKNRSQRDLSTVFYLNVAIALTIYLILCLSAPWIAQFLKHPILTRIIRIYCLTLVINSLSSTGQTILTINLDFKTTTKISFASGVISGIIGIVMAYCDYGVWALVGQSIAYAAVTTLLTFILVRWVPRHGFSSDSFRRLFSFSSKLFAASLISAVYEKIFGIIIGKMFSTSALGFYDRAISFNQLLNNNISTVLGRVSYPLLSRIQDDDERLIGIYRRYIEISAFLTFPLLMMLCGIAKPLILALLTAKWAPSILLLQVLTFGFLWDGVIVSNLNLIKVKGRSDLVLKLEIIKKLIAFTLCIGSLVVFRSVLALCIAKAIYGFIALILNTVYTKKLLNYGFLRQLRDYRAYLAASVGVLAISLLVSELISNSWIALFTGIVFSGLFYLTICHCFRLYAYTETIGILQSKLGPIVGKFRKNS